VRRIRVAAAFVGAVICVGLSAGCSRDQRTGVEGAVTFDGKPIRFGNITFVPTGNGKGISAGDRIADGRYKFDPKFGLYPGPHRVEITWAKPTGQKYKNELGDELDRLEEGLPDKYHKNSTLTADVKAGENVIDFHLTK
jgi:hypothetical protein